MNGAAPKAGAAPPRRLVLGRLIVHQESFMKKWLLATRPWSFTASVIPLTLGAALAWASDAAHAGLFLLTLLGGVAIQTGTNMLNIYGDYLSGVDTEASAHGESPILLGLISGNQ